MAKANQAPVQFDMLDVGDELYVINAMLTAVNNFNQFERSEYNITHAGMLMIIDARVRELKCLVDKHNEAERQAIK